MHLSNNIKLKLHSTRFRLKTISLVILSSFLFSCSNDDNAEVSSAIPIPLDCDIELTQALGFNAFVLNGISLTSGDSEGPLAMGGDLTLNGIFTAAAHTSGTLFNENDNEASSLIVNGKINYVTTEGEGVHLNNGYVKVGDLSGSVTHDIDDNNAVNNTRITQGDYNASPRVHVQRNQDASTISAIDIIDFQTAFEGLNANSIYYSELPNNVSIQSGNKIDLLDNSFNVLHLTGEELNDLVNFTFNDQPTATSPLIINIDQQEDFIWDVQNQAGIGDQHGAHIIFNFYNNNSSITLDTGGATVIGSVLAPNSHVIKRTSGNINGQLIAASYDHESGELHQHVFNICEENACELVVNLGEDLFLDFGETFTLIANANFEDVSFVWSTNETTESINLTPSETTTYTVTATLPNGCITTDSITINLGDDPCTSEVFNVAATTVVNDLVNFLNIDIAVAQDQLINYAIYEEDGITLAGLPIEAELVEGCNTISLNLNDHFNFVANTTYVLEVTAGNDLNESIEFIIP